MKKKLPRRVFVQWYEDESAQYLLAAETESEAVNADARRPGERVGVYELVEVVRITEHDTYTKRRLAR